MFGNSRVCIEQFVCNFDEADVDRSKSLFELYTPSILYENICCSANNDLMTLLCVYNKVTSIYHDESSFDFPAKQNGIMAFSLSNLGLEIIDKWMKIIKP